MARDSLEESGEAGEQLCGVVSLSESSARLYWLRCSTNLTTESCRRDHDEVTFSYRPRIAGLRSRVQPDEVEPSG
jgi:hypothetical protein